VSIGLHATLFRLLDAKEFSAKSERWIYFHELLGLRAHLEALSISKLPTPAIVNMQGPEALNSIASRFHKDYTRGLSFLGTPNGRLAKVRI
jgi:hypothetical protein